MAIHIDNMTPADWPAVRAIYQEGIATGQATFETAIPGWVAWDAARLPHSRLVARANDAVAGWATLSPVSRRAVYTGVAEVSIYVAGAYDRLARHVVRQEERPDFVAMLRLMQRLILRGLGADADAAIEPSVIAPIPGSSLL